MKFMISFLDMLVCFVSFISSCLWWHMIIRIMCHHEHDKRKIMIIPHQELKNAVKSSIRSQKAEIIANIKRATPHFFWQIRFSLLLNPSVSKWMVGGIFGNKLWVRGGRTAGLAGTAVAGRRVLGRTSSSLGVATCLTAVTGLVALADFARERADDDRRDRLLVME